MNKTLYLAFLGAALLAAPSAMSAEEGADKVGYGTVTLQLQPMMAPYNTPSGRRYEPLTVRLMLAPGETERVACFMIPVIHEKMVIYLHTANLTFADFQGQRREVLEKRLFDVAVDTTDKSYFTGLALVDDPGMPPVLPGTNVIVEKKTPPLDPRSTTLSAQCK